jgi:phage-related protein
MKPLDEISLKFLKPGTKLKCINAIYELRNGEIYEFMEIYSINNGNITINLKNVKHTYFINRFTLDLGCE